MGDKFKADASIDLHGLRPDEALARVRRMVESGRYSDKSIEIIHGQGRGVLRERVREWGERSSKVKRMVCAEDIGFLGGGGVTIFFL